MKKNKRIKKRLEKITKQLDILSSRSNPERPRKKSNENLGHISEYDKDVSDKIYNFIISLCGLKKTNIELNKNFISISLGNIEEPDDKHSSSSGIKARFASKEEDENFLNIRIDKTKFAVDKSYITRTLYKDENMFNKLHPIISKVVDERSKEYTLGLIDEVLIKTKLIRDNNLKELGI